MLVQNYIAGASAVKIASSIEEAVASGRAAAGDRLPTVRDLAARLRISPATAGAAYRMLQERGIIAAEGRRGTFIRAGAAIVAPPAVPLPRNVVDVASGNPDPELLPDLTRFARKLDLERRLYADHLNDARLLELARQQFAADGIDATHTGVVSGALDGIERVLREHLRPGDRVLVEDPGFTGVADLLHAQSLIAVPVALDDEGFLPHELRRALASKADAVIVTPRAQNPTGAAITLRRARQLRAILDAQPELLVMEDDHAGPVAGADYVTLIDPGKRHRWAVVRSVSKSLGPDLRLAVLAADGRTLARVEGRQTLGIRWVSHILQQLVVRLWSDRSARQLLAFASKNYAMRRRALTEALRERGIEAHAVSGLNVWIPLRDEAAVVQALFDRGWAVAAGERYRIRSGPAIRVTVAAMDLSQTLRFAEDLTAIVDEGAGRKTRPT